MKRILATIGLGMSLALALVGIANAQAFGPRPVYVRPDLRVWTLPPSAASEEILEALDKIAKDFRLSLVPIEGQEQAFRLSTKRRLNGRQLDEYCEYPIRNLEDWDPMSTFARDFMRAHREKWEHQWDGKMYLDFYLSPERGQSSKVKSYCYFYLGRGSGPFGGSFHATSLGVYEKAPIQSLLDSLGIRARIAVEGLSRTEPDIESIEFFLLIQQECGLSGVYVHPKTGEVSCTPPGAVEPIKRLQKPAVAERKAASAFPIQVQKLAKPKAFPIRIEKPAASLEAEVLYAEMNPDAHQSVLPLSIKACGGSLTSASVVEVNGTGIEEIPLLLGTRTEAGACEEVRATLDVMILAQRLVEGSNRFVVQAGEMTAEVVLEIQ